MLSLRRPTDEVIKTVLTAQAELAFTYQATGATATTAPECYVVDRTRVLLGADDDTFQRAKTSLRRWKQFDLGWLYAFPNDATICPGQVVAVVARAFGVWSINAARIVYVIDEPTKFGFAYGTLPGHVESGEERFLIEQTDDGSVWYDIIAFSQPRHFLTRLGYPFVRRLQKRFGRESSAAMLRAVRDTAS